MQDNDIDGSGKAASAGVTAPQTVADVQHTPGPFAVHPVKAWIMCSQLDEEGEPTPVAALAHPTAYRSEVETRANGALFAAAPDLRAALHSILPSPLCGESWDLPDEEMVQITVTLGELRAARAALRAAATSARQGETK